MEALLKNLRTSLTALFLLLTVGVQAQEEKAQLITFKIRNAGVNVKGTFRDHTIKARFDEANVADAYFEANIEVSSLDTGIKGRDKHLKKTKYFDLENYPYIAFKSKRVQKTAEGYTVTGDLRIKSTTREVEIPFTVTTLEGKNRDFKGNLTIDRRDYKVGKGHLIMGDEVRIEINYQYRPQ